MSHLSSDMKEEPPTALERVEVDHVIKMECEDIKIEPPDTEGDQTEASSESNAIQDIKKEPVEIEDDKTETSTELGLVTN